MTAVEFLESKIFGDEIFSLSKVIEQVKEMEKQQIIDAYELGMGHYGDANRRADAEQYYNETFKNK